MIFILHAVMIFGMIELTVKSRTFQCNNIPTLPGTTSNLRDNTVGRIIYG